MGFNISEVSGNFAGGPNLWTATVDMQDPSVSSISGDFDEVPLFGGGPSSEADDGYTFSAVTNPGFGTLTFNTTDGTFTFTIDRDAMRASGSDQVVSFTVEGFEDGDSDDDVVEITILLCVARGTLVATPTGDTAVETISVGDRVITKDNGSVSVRWIGRRALGRRELDKNPDLRPIRIRAGALGEGQPSRDLVVSPQHRMLLSGWHAELLFGEDEVLVPAKGLLNDKSIVVDYAMDAVEYFHLMFDSHQIIVTENSYSESFFPGDYSMREIGEAARQELIKLFPELGKRPGAYGQTARLCVRPKEASLFLDDFDWTKIRPKGLCQ